VQACSSSGICSTEPNPMRCLNAERAECGGGCSSCHTSGEKVEDELEARVSFGGNDLKEERGTEANFAAVETSRR
jgi:hypothetical protein